MSLAIQRKYSLGQHVWVMKNNKPLRVEIMKIVISVTHTPGFAIGDNTENIVILYQTNEKSGQYGFEESACFLSKEDLLASL